MFKKTAIFLGGLIGFVALIAGPLFLIKITQFKKMGEGAKHMVPPPTTVTATPVKSDAWENNIAATGSVVAVQGVTIGAEVPGKVTEIAFEAGATVKADDVLVKLDTSTEEAQLRAAEATAVLAKANLARAKDLRNTNTNSVAELDAADAQAKQAQAQADSIRAVIAKKTIRAPFTGRLGLRQINLGQILKDGEAITTLQTLDPIYVNFSLPQQRLAALKDGLVVRVRNDSIQQPEGMEGKITAISPEVDPVTRNVRVQATFANTGEHLRAGMFVNVDVVLPTKTQVLAIPVTAVLYAPYGDSVFVVDEKKDESGKVQQVLRQQFVRLGESRGDFVNVVEGLKPGETVVTSGVFKLRGGANVVIDNTLAPPAKMSPKPKNA